MGGGGEKHGCERETWIGCLQHGPDQGIEHATFWCGDDTPTKSRVSHTGLGQCILTKWPFIGVRGRIKKADLEGRWCHLWKTFWNWGPQFENNFIYLSNMVLFPVREFKTSFWLSTCMQINLSNDVRGLLL